MRCPDCNKFVSFEVGEPEITEENGPDDNSIEFEVLLGLNCSECGTELKTASFNMGTTFDILEAHADEESHELELTDTGAEATLDKASVKVMVHGRVFCKSCAENIGSFEMHDSLATADFEEC